MSSKEKMEVNEDDATLRRLSEDDAARTRQLEKSADQIESENGGGNSHKRDGYQILWTDNPSRDGAHRRGPTRHD